MTAGNDDDALPTASATTNGIGLGEIIDLLVRRWPFIGGAALLSAGVTFGVVAIREPDFTYTTTIQIGGPTDSDGVRPIIEPTKLAEKLNSGYIINSDSFQATFPAALSYKVEALALGNSPLLRLDIKGSLADETTIIELLRGVSGTVLDRCAELINLSQRQDLLARRSALEKKAEQLRNKIARHEQNLARIAEVTRSYQSQLAEAKTAMTSANEERKSAVAAPDPNLRALTHLLTSNTLQRALDNIFRLDDKLNDSIPRQREDLNAAISEAQLELAASDAESQKTQRQLDALQESEVFSAPIRLHAPLGVSSARILAVAGLGGALLGLCGAFLADLVGRRKKEGML